MDDLVRWLRAQLDEDERITRAVEDRSAPWDGQWMADGDSAVRTANGHVLFYRHDSGPLKPGLADHTAAWDPARVLREIDAKRQVIAKFTTAVERMAELASLCERLKAEGESTFMPEMDRATAIHRRDVLYEVLKLHALPYADRSGYRDEWRP